LGVFSVKKLILAAVLAATTAPAYAAVTYTFSGAEFDGGAAISGSITIDTDALLGANGATDPALYYYYATGDGSSTVASPFLTVSFTSAGTQPVLMSAGDSTFQELQADPSDGSFTLELDWSFTNSDGTVRYSQFSLNGSGTILTTGSGGTVLPDFAHSGDFYVSVLSGDGANQSPDLSSTGQVSFAAAPGVPEASTWAMMVMGFGAVGYAARRRARVAFA
jgi:hypothetical protein